MFGRDKTTSTAAGDETGDDQGYQPVKVGGKGRSTPKRKESQARNRRPLIGTPPVPQGATKEERKAAKAARTAANRTERARARTAISSGDERYLSARDKGPARRFVRDYIDARRNLGEYFLPIALFSLVIGVINSRALHVASIILLYGMVLVIAADSFLLRRRMQKMVDERFAGKNVPGISGAGTYGLMRALQFRRGRNPKPQVGRGEFPV